MADWVTEQVVREYSDIVSLSEAFVACGERIQIDLQNSRLNSRNDVWITRAMLAAKVQKAKKGTRAKRKRK